MKVRAQRTHYMGTSNRNQEAFNNNSNYKTQSVFERSFNKSKSLFSHPQSEVAEGTLNQSRNARTNPFLGTHNELQTSRFDKQNMRPYKYTKMNFPVGRRTITFAPLLNNDVRQIQSQFKDKKINMHKLKELKQAFVKNNRDRRNIQTYFDQYSVNGTIDTKGLQKVVKQYGFDITDDEAKLIFRLTHKSNKSSQKKDELKIDGFVQLMTKDDVYYRTMLLSQSKDNNQYTFQANFSQKVHQILRNKFPRLKEAFKIYRQRKENVGLKQFQYVMKKLDLTDLVISQQQRNEIYNKYANQNGEFNVEALICAIAEQQHQNRQSKSIFRPNQFMEDLKANKQIQFTNSMKNRHFGMKTLSNLQYQNQFHKAKTVIQQLKKVKAKKKNEKQNDNIYRQYANGQDISQQELIRATEKIFKKEGVNFHKQEYEAFAAYLNYDVNGVISLNKLNHELFVQNQKQARDRIQRRVRYEAPKASLNNSSYIDCDKNAAIQTIIKIKAHRMNPETRQLFKFLDEDRDGFVSQKQFKQKLNSLSIAQNWQIQNLANHLKINEQGSINFRNFSEKINEDLELISKDLPLVRGRNSKSCYDWTQTTKLKNGQIKMDNYSEYQRPTKFSAWPTNLTHQDLSLVQAPPRAGTYASETERFENKKDEYGMKQKMMAMAVAQGRRQKIAEWNNKLQQRAEANRQKQEQRMAAKNYMLRLTKQKYELNCHQ